MFESKNADRISDFELKLMDIDSEQLGIPDSEYGATVRWFFFPFPPFGVGFFFFFFFFSKNNETHPLSLSPSLFFPFLLLSLPSL